MHRVVEHIEDLVDCNRFEQSFDACVIEVVLNDFQSKSALFSSVRGILVNDRRLHNVSISLLMQ